MSSNYCLPDPVLQQGYLIRLWKSNSLARSLHRILVTWSYVRIPWSLFEGLHHLNRLARLVDPLHLRLSHCRHPCVLIQLRYCWFLLSFLSHCTSVVARHSFHLDLESALSQPSLHTLDRNRYSTRLPRQSSRSRSLERFFHHHTRRLLTQSLKYRGVSSLESFLEESSPTSESLELCWKRSCDTSFGSWVWTSLRDCCSSSWIQSWVSSVPSDHSWPGTCSSYCCFPISVGIRDWTHSRSCSWRLDFSSTSSCHTASHCS